MYSFGIKIKAKPGERVIVTNYRTRTNKSELATVLSVSIDVLPDLLYRTKYHVVLDRKSTKNQRIKLSVTNKELTRI